MFIVMGAIGRVVKKDLSGMGRALMGVLIGVIIASVVNMFLRSSGMDYILSIISVFLFAGLTAWDNQKIHMSMIKQMVNLLARLGSSDGFGTLS